MIFPIQDLETNTVQHSNKPQDDTKQIELENQSQKSKASTRKLIEKPQQTIEVLSDQEEQQIISEKFQQQVFRAKIQEAKLTKSKYAILKVLYVELNFRSKKDHEKENRFNSMVRMYVSKNLKTCKGEPFDLRTSHFSDKMVPNPGEGFVENEYLLYGCDLLPHKHIEKMFQFYSPSIKWINASHCRLTFMSKTQGWDAVINNCLDFENLKKYIQQNEKVELLMDKLELQGDREMEEQHETKYNEEYFKMQKFKKEYHLLKEFIELMPYYELGFERKLLIRNVTCSQQLIGYDLNGQNKSVKSLGSSNVPTPEIKKPQSQYKKYLRVKECLWREIQNSPLVKPQYEKIQKQIYRQQELLWIGKRPPQKDKSPAKTSQNYNQRNPNFSQRGNHNNFYPQRSFNDNYSMRNNFHNQQYPIRNRSRDQHFHERHYPREGQAYRDRNYNRQNHNKFIYRNDLVERAFENYIERRDEVRIIENPHKYLQPQFIDKRTGLHFYRNPFYNPPIQAQLSYGNYNYQQEPQGYNSSTPAYDYGSSSINNTNLSGYQYDGNINCPQNLNPSQKSHQRNGSKHSVQSNQRKPSTEEMFNNYCSQRDNGISQEQINMTKHQKKQSVQNDLNQLPFEAQDFSIINEQKIPNRKQNDQRLIDQNLENILDQIHEDQRCINLGQSNQYQQNPNFANQQGQLNLENDDDSQDLQFMLRDRQDFNIKCEIKQQYQSKILSNNQKGFIEQKIKEQHIPIWLKSNPVVEDFGESSKFSNLAVNNQNSAEIQQNFEEIVCDYPEKTSSESIKNMRKKIHVKKRDSSNSKSKREGQSLTKKNKF